METSETIEISIKEMLGTSDPTKTQLKQVIDAAEKLLGHASAAREEKQLLNQGSSVPVPAVQPNTSAHTTSEGSNQPTEGYSAAVNSMESDQTLTETEEGGWAVVNSMELEEKFDKVIANSSVVEQDVSNWFDEFVPTDGLGKAAIAKQKDFFIRVGKRTRLARKMGRWGVAIKMFLTLFLGYADILTDLLVAKSYYEVEEYATAYATAGIAIFVIMLQATATFLQYASRGWKQRLGHTLLALLGLAPLVEGMRVWTGKEDSDLMLSGPQMYAAMKAIEIGFESIPESVIQVGGLLRGNSAGVQAIQIIGVVSSIASGAFIMTDGNFAMAWSKHRECPGDPYYRWVTKRGGLELAKQMFGMFMFNACYFSQFILAMSLVAQAFKTPLPLLLLIVIEMALVFAYMAYKKELFGFAVIAKPSPIANVVAPFLTFSFYYILVCAVPLIIAAAPCELGPEVFAAIMVWRLLTNGGFIYLALGELGEEWWEFLSLTKGMMGYGVSLGLAAVGLALFLRNCDKNFDRSLIWRPKSGKNHNRDCWIDDECWKRKSSNKEEERWLMMKKRHPLYLPYDEMKSWICKTLVEKYHDRKVERPAWMFGEEAEGKLIKRITIIFKYYGKDSVEVDDALVTLFGRSGRNLKRIGKHMTFIMSRDSGRSSVLAGGISSMFSKTKIESKIEPHIGEGGSKLEPNAEDGVSELEP